MTKHIKALIRTPLLFACLMIQSAPATLSLYRETASFHIFCTEADHPAANVVLQRCEGYLEELSRDFHHIYSAPITLNMYPDIQTFHQETGYPDSPDWYVGLNDSSKHAYNFVSPNNPGTYHTTDSILNALKVGLAELFISDIYKKPMPRWLHQGVALFEANFASISGKKRIAQLAKNPSQLPTLAQLSPMNDETFEQLDGFACSETLIEFINEKWGWETLLALLDNIDAFEAILGMAQDVFHKQWATFLVEKYSE